METMVAQKDSVEVTFVLLRAGDDHCSARLLPHINPPSQYAASYHAQSHLVEDRFKGALQDNTSCTTHTLPYIQHG
jgi:hypothetical protein